MKRNEGRWTSTPASDTPMEFLGASDQAMDDAVGLLIQLAKLWPMLLPDHRTAVKTLAAMFSD